MVKFKNKYRIESIRAQWWDYRNAGAYFITICTKNRVPYFGIIKDGKMQLSPTGVLAYVFWHEIPKHTANAEIGAFVVMPNHIHGIIILPPQQGSVEMLHATSPLHDPVERLHATSLEENTTKNEYMSSISPKANSVSSIVRSYKSAVTKHANRLGLENGWQSNYYEHIIRTDASFERITQYIKNNPKNWSEDKFK